MSVDLTRLQMGMFQTLQSRLSPLYPDPTDPIDVSWVYGSPSFETLPKQFVALRLLSGPTPVHRTPFAKGQAFFPPTQIDITVSAVVEGFRYYLELNEFSYFYDSQVGDTDTIIRDGLIAALSVLPSNPWLVTPVGLDTLRIDPTSFGAIFQGSRSENLTPLTTFSPDAALYSEGTRQSLIEIQTYSKEPTQLASGAWYVMDNINDILSSISAVDQLWATWGIAIQNLGTTTDLTALAGPNWESRQSQTITINQRSTAVEPVDIIENLDLTLNTTVCGGLTSYQDTLQVPPAP